MNTYDPEPLTFQIAVYRSAYSSPLFFQYKKDNYPLDWVQTHAPVEVTFQPLSQAEVILAEVAQIDEEIRQTADRLHQELTRLKDRKNTLLALIQQ